MTSFQNDCHENCLENHVLVLPSIQYQFPRDYNYKAHEHGKAECSHPRC